MKNLLLVPVLLLVLGCTAQPEPTSFSEDVLQDVFMSLEGDAVTLDAILKSHEGKTVLIDVWATWCRDCIVGLPNLKSLQEQYTNVVYVFISMDKTQESWKRGIKKYEIEGEHYFMEAGWDSKFSTYIDLDWIPRYMIINKQGDIKLFRAIKASDPKIEEHLN